MLTANRPRFGILLTCATAALLVVAGCAPSQLTAGAAPSQPAATGPATKEAGRTGTPSPRAPLPAARQTVLFEAGDGQELEGHYYPAAENPAPAVVLMHWARGDDSSWAEIACWLQNRGQGGRGAPTQTWLDPSWFPAMPEGLSFAVFTFTFRTCGEGDGCQDFDAAGWLLDAKAAVQTARGMDGVDGERVVAIGASIGADAAADACGDGCRGAMSLSPGSYLTVPYPEAVARIDASEPSRPAWCVGAEGDGDVVALCERASGDRYRVIVYKGSLHGMELIRPGVDPDPMALILEFLDLSLAS